MLKLLSTDFDGTLIGFSPEEASCVPSLALELEKMCHEGGFWAINTGRPFEVLLEGLDLLEAPIKPHYVITSERYIHYPHADGSWRAFEDWNERCLVMHQELFKQCGSFFEKLNALTEEYEGEVTVFKNCDGVPDELIASSEELLDEIELRLQGLQHHSEEVVFQRSHMHLRFCHHFYNKVSVLSELSRFLAISSDHILAIGDHHNDIAMLDLKIASMLACPANAHARVKETVSRARGHISQYIAGEGTAEAIRKYRQGTGNR